MRYKYGHMSSARNKILYIKSFLVESIINLNICERKDRKVTSVTFIARKQVSPTYLINIHSPRTIHLLFYENLLRKY